MRILLLALLILLALYGVNVLAQRGLRWFQNLVGGGSRSAEVHRGSNHGSEVVRAGELSACSVCGVHVLTTRMLSDGSRHFCSEACRRRAAEAS